MLLVISLFSKKSGNPLFLPGEHTDSSKNFDKFHQIPLMGECLCKEMSELSLCASTMYSWIGADSLSNFGGRIWQAVVIVLHSSPFHQRVCVTQCT